MKQLLDKLLKIKLIRFGAVGGAGMFVNAGALAVAKEFFGLHDLAAWFFGFFVAVTFTWWGNRTFTFHENKSGHKGILAEWARFFATNSFGAAANFCVYALLLWWKPWPLNLLATELRAYPALCVGVLVGLVFNFTLSKKLVFRGKTAKPTAPP